MIYPTCYKEEGSKQSDDVAVRRKIEIIKQKMDILIDMRTEGDISISDFRERKQKLELELQECENQLREQIQPVRKESEQGLDWEAIRKTLNEAIDFSNPKIEDALVERFIAKIVPQGDNKFTWFVNLSGQTQESIDMIVEGRKNNPTIYIDETDEDEEDPSSVHNKKRRKSTRGGAIKGEKYSLTATPHRQLSLINKID